MKMTAINLGIERLTGRWRLAMSLGTADLGAWKRGLQKGHCPFKWLLIGKFQIYGFAAAD